MHAGHRLQWKHALKSRVIFAVCDILEVAFYCADEAGCGWRWDREGIRGGCSACSDCGLHPHQGLSAILLTLLPSLGQNLLTTAGPLKDCFRYMH